MNHNLIVLTGGPGAGKSTLIAELARRGMSHVEETGRRIIRQEMASGGTALPWADRSGFAMRMLEAEIANHAMAADASEPIVFDRGVPDVVGYLRLCRLDVPDEASEAARRCRYGPTVFILPPWPEIFANDAERRQDFAEAVRTHDMMAATYADLGYDLCPIPAGRVEARADALMDRLSSRAAPSRE